MEKSDFNEANATQILPDHVGTLTWPCLNSGPKKIALSLLSYPAGFDSFKIDFVLNSPGSQQPLSPGSPSLHPVPIFPSLKPLSLSQAEIPERPGRIPLSRTMESGRHAPHPPTPGPPPASESYICHGLTQR